mgnify:FL=1|jgi:uncharacterized protein YehS (DUF1456 family)|tara:strand:+ start:2227 stop:2676 length:450 start_codon:yes stop_codon:yes gene_type:complete
MTNNDILRRLRYAFDFNNVQVAKIMAHIKVGVEPVQVGRWIQQDDSDSLSDFELCKFLDGLIIEKRGARPDGSIPEPQQSITRNEILKKLRIALSLRDEGMMAVFKEADFVVTKAELGSFFRKQGQRNYAECPEQVLRKFIHGLGQEAG